MLDKLTATELIQEARLNQGLSWQQLADHLAMSVVWTTSACLGMNSMPRPQAELLVDLLGLPPDVTDALTRYPTKTWTQAVPTDPLIYRLYEVIGVYGETLKEVIQEQFGDGIMSAIDFSMDVKREAHPNGDRVVLTLNGKFLPYKSW